MPLDLLMKETSDASDDIIMSAVYYIRFLKNEKKGENLEVKRKGNIRDLYGIYKGKGWMSDDFDEPLEDFKEYME